MTGTQTDAAVPTTAVNYWLLVPAVLLSSSAVFMFVFENNLAGYLLQAASLIAAFMLDRRMFRDLALVVFGLVAISLVPLNADLSIEHIALMGMALTVAAVFPYFISRFVYKDHAIRIPVGTGKRWGKVELGYLALVVGLGYSILPVYLISTGVYQNWPDASDPDIFVRLFLGVNFVGIWDELFFIITTFTLLRRYFPDWIANLLQAVIFCSFLWEIGYQSWGPLLTFPFALLQGYTFKLTKSFTYVVTVHLIFDFVLFLTLVHAHNREWLPIFVY